MNADVMSGSWDQMRTEVRRRWSKLSDQDLSSVKGEVDRLVDAVQDKYGYSRRKAREQVSRFVRTYGDDMQETTSGFMADAREFVSRYPWSLGVAILVVGLVVGLLVARPSLQNGWDR